MDFFSSVLGGRTMAKLVALYKKPANAAAFDA